MKKLYKSPEIDFISFDAQDVITNGTNLEVPSIGGEIIYEDEED